MKVRLPLLGALFGAGLAPTAGAGDLGYPASALAEFSAKPRASFDNAPPLAPAPFASPFVADQSAASPPPAAPPVTAQAEAAPAASSPKQAPSEQTPAEETLPERAPSESSPATTTGLDEYEARCFVKLEGRVVTARPCRILREKDREVIFQIEDGPLTIKLRQGRVWTARLKDRDLGIVYRTGPCWGAKGFYACDRGKL